MPTHALESLLQDLRFGVRTLRKSPGFTAIAIGTLALGIGVNAAIFSIFNAVALRPLAAAHPDRVITIDRHTNGGYLVLSWPDYTDIRDTSRTVADLAAWTHAPLTFGGLAGGATSSEDARGMMVTHNFFRVFGAQPVVGRFFIPEEDRAPDASRVVVLSHAYWQRRFGGDRSVVGRTVLLNLQPFTVVGIAPASFIGPDPMPSDMWVPVMMERMFMRHDLLHDRDSGWLHVIGLLQPGASVSAAQAEVDVIWKHMPHDRPVEAGEGMQVSRATFLPPNGRPMVMPLGILVLVATSMVLLIACANIANLLLARASARQREIGVRLSLGAGRARLMRQLLTESSLLAGAGAILSYAFFERIPRLLWTLIPQAPTGFDFSPDLRVMIYTAGLAVIAALAFGVIPALHATRTEINSTLRDGSTTAGFRVRRSFIRGALVTAQVTVCLALLAGAGLLTRALGRAQNVNVGFNTKDVVTLSTDARLHNYDAKRLLLLNDQLIERVRGLPGVQSVGQVALVPLSSATWVSPVSADPRRKPDGPGFPLAGFNEVSSSYFTTLQMRMVMGRTFSDADARADRPVAVISESMARTLWPGQNPIGRHFRTDRTYDVVGVAADARNDALWSEGAPYVYLPITPASEGLADARLVVRTSASVRQLAAALPGVVKSVDNSLNGSAGLLQDNLALWLIPSRAGAALATSLGLLAMLLAAIGIYGVTAFAVEQRTKEIGIRMALGANPGHVLRATIVQSLRPVLLGIALGLPLAGVLGTLIRQLLYGIAPFDPIALGGVCGFLIAVALLAIVIPGRRAVRIDPAVALRHE